MHKAPAVDYPVGLSRYLNLVFFSVWFVVAGVYVVWWFLVDRIGWQHALATAATLIAAALSIRAWGASSTGRLQWDGQSWWWDTGEFRASGEIMPRLHLQGLMLLEFSSHSGVRHWLWLQQRVAPLRWSALRRAVYAPGQVVIASVDSAIPADQPSQQVGFTR